MRRHHQVVNEPRVGGHARLASNRQRRYHRRPELHRDVRGGSARAAVFGMSDGLVSNVSLVLGIAGAGVSGATVRLAGLTGLLAGAVSMAAGEYVSMKAQTELLQRELDIERRELVDDPQGELRELAALYEKRGLAPERARQVAGDLMRNPEQALEAHAREELGIDPEELGAPVRAAGSSFVAFAVGALAPLLPWFVASGAGAAVATLVIGLLVALVLGTGVARLSGRPPLRSALRQAGLAGAACAVTWLLGRAVGVTV